MKSFINPLLFAAVIFAFSGCSDDDDPKSTSKIVGKWKVKSFEPAITVPGGNLHDFLVTSGMTDEEATLYEAFLVSEDFAELEIETIEFKDNLTYSTSDGSGTQNGTWEISSDEKTLIVDKGTDHEDHVAVKTLNDTTFAFEVDLSEEVDIPGITYKVTTTFERQ